MSIRISLNPLTRCAVCVVCVSFHVILFERHGKIQKKKTKEHHENREKKIQINTTTKNHDGRN